MKKYRSSSLGHLLLALGHRTGTGKHHDECEAEEMEACVKLAGRVAAHEGGRAGS